MLRIIPIFLCKLNMQIKALNGFIFFIFLLLMIRLVTLGLYPLMDTTEARYAEIARLMLESGDWITPHFDKETPFWGKPPLSFWLTALSFKFFGVSEFTARLPSLLLGCLSLCLVYFASKALEIKNRLLPVLMLLSTAVFFVAIAAVMTEASLLFGLVLSTVAALFILNQQQQSIFWIFVFFLGLAIGMLAKGPIILIFVVLPLCLWAIIHGQIKLVWQKFHWLAGILIFLLICAPWYYLAEQKTPGFINYFIVGEHFKRFLVSGWQGDLYGTAHRKPYGTIWLFWIMAFFPWSLSIYYLLKSFVVKLLKKNTKLHFSLDKIDYLLLYWAFFPVLFFTFAGNILWTYVLPGLPAFVLLLARKIEQCYANPDNSNMQEANTYLNSDVENSDVENKKQGDSGLLIVKRLKQLSLLTPLITIIALFAVNIFAEKMNSEKYLIQQIVEQQANTKLYFLPRDTFSARFYAKGKIETIEAEQLVQIQYDNSYLAVHKEYIAIDELKKLNKEQVNENKHYVLYKIAPFINK